MTTDITELAQSLKAAAENAIGAHERLAAYPYDEIIDISQHEGEQIDIDITDLNEFNKEANPVNILALVEALEKAQQFIARQGQILLNQDESLSIRRGELEFARRRIAELESRIVTVKIPSTVEPSPFAPWIAKAFYQFHKDTVNSCVTVFSDACAAAGIKVETE
ncbi:ead/Ea22-like family protein [Klebsiella pneumoniae]|uniref:ead/Ea22-like family protein n=1 Tax=Klebsiella pneumoniae TaxID=573 RepID=UPI0018C745F6|nr:ead/Ea22-like family protein [Klebsiella pneumoniae]MBG2019297.1 ead/Ea22-like family protein [Klebsiella pneumoniae]MBG2238929.1 ead/Ea22-like family protein [Klebsiella pneumoniae]MBZ1924998.1 ead/Ea22-like family protein [Klebsiella pneumoniae]MCD9676340.1 ead/Ea22-like family protein [Klebsiella pneumoniae]MCD9972828.1 ead/Ea22-like family protein [Klebsiella pneumoniae]